MSAGSVRQAVVLCAGRATRLGELARHGPKPMLPVAGRPLIEHIVTKLLGAGGFEQIVLVVGADAKFFESLFGDEPRVQFAHQTTPRGTADALLSASALLAGRFLVTYGDLWVATDDYGRLRESAESDGQPRLAVNRTDRPTGAAVYLEEERIIRIVEKPIWDGQADTCWNAAGMYVLDRDLLHDCRAVSPSPRGELELTCAIQRTIDRGTPIFRYIMSQAQIDIGVPERYHALCAELSKASSSSETVSAERRIARPRPQAE